MRSFARVLLAFALLGSAFAQAQTATITVTPSSQTTAVGSNVLVSVSIAGLLDGVAPSLGAFDLNLLFDPSILSVSNFSFGTGLDVLGLGSVQFSDVTTPGLLSIGEISLDLPADLNTLQSGAFALFTVTFQAVGTGVSALGLDINALSDAYGEALAATTINGSVSAVPLPAAVWLLLSGVLGVCGFSRRRRA